jgi:transposase-like protein
MRKRELHPKEMYSLYEQWLLLGQSRAIFAKEHGLRASTFYYWAKKFEKGPLIVGDILDASKIIVYPSNLIRI